MDRHSHKPNRYAVASTRRKELLDEIESCDTLIKSLLESSRKRLGMDVAFVSEFVGNRRVFRFVDCAPAAVDIIHVNTCGPLGDSYCKKVVEGTLPELIHNAQDLPAACEIPATKILGIGAHISVPITLSDGTVFGTFCAFSFKENYSLGESELSFIRVFSDVASALLEKNWLQIRSANTMRQQLETLLQSNALRVVCQPIVVLKDKSVAGVEALLRASPATWRPDILFAEAERVGLIHVLSEKALALGLDLFNKIPDSVFISLNFSPEHILHCDLARYFSGVPVHRLVLEITEHAIIGEYQAIAQRLKPWREKGLKLAVDDAGAGYASFRHIITLKPDIIKMDISLVRNINRDDERQALAIALVEFSKQRNYMLIAEGIETEEELQSLKSLGVQYGQGYLLARPQPIEAFKELFS